jgi:hypothetical protein
MDNPNLITAVVSAHPLFANIASFTLVNAFRQMGWLPDESPDVGEFEFVIRDSESILTNAITGARESESLGTITSKAFGKRKALRPLQPDASVTDLASKIGRNGFVPTEEWVRTGNHGTKSYTELEPVWRSHLGSKGQLPCNPNAVN